MVSRGLRVMKGFAINIEEIFAGLLAIVLVVFIFNLFVGHYFDLKTIINENTVDRHAIALGNVLVSSDKIAYSDGIKTYRDILDVKKLDQQVTNQNNFNAFLTISQSSELLKDVSYPNSLIAITIIDKETGNSWILAGNGQMTIQAFSGTIYSECLFSKLKVDVPTVARVMSNTFLFGVSGLTSIWSKYDLEECNKQFGQSLGTAIVSFPVAIRISENDVHVGIMSIRLTEY